MSTFVCLTLLKKYEQLFFSNPKVKGFVKFEIQISDEVSSPVTIFSSRVNRRLPFQSLT